MPCSVWVTLLGNPNKLEKSKFSATKVCGHRISNDDRNFGILRQIVLMNKQNSQETKQRESKFEFCTNHKLNTVIAERTSRCRETHWLSRHLLHDLHVMSQGGGSDSFIKTFLVGVVGSTKNWLLLSTFGRWDSVTTNNDRAIGLAIFCVKNWALNRGLFIRYNLFSMTSGNASLALQWILLPTVFTFKWICRHSVKNDEEYRL